VGCSLVASRKTFEENERFPRKRHFAVRMLRADGSYVR